MALAGKIGRRGRVYVQEQSAFGTIENSASSGAVRHLNIDGAFNPFNVVESEEKKQSPGLVNVHDRRMTAGWDLTAYLIPSGALNTLCETNKLLEHGIGSKTNVTNSTTVMNNADDSEVDPTTTAFTVTDVGAWVAGDLICVPISGVNYYRRIGAIAAGSGSAPIKRITVTQALPSAPANNAVIKGGVTYKLISGEAAKLLTVYHYVDTFKRAWRDCVVEELKLMFDANSDYRIQALGPAAEQIASGSVASLPAGFTTVGAKPVSGISGRLEVGTAGAAYKILKGDFGIKNGYEMRNESLGYNKAEEVYRAGRRAVSCAIDARVEDPTIIYDNAFTGTPIPLQLTAGLTEGRVFVVHVPLARFDVPATPDGEGALTWSFAAKCLESADSANDEIVVGAF